MVAAQQIGGNCSAATNYRSWRDVPPKFGGIGQVCGDQYYCSNSFFHGTWRTWADTKGTVCQKDPTVAIADQTANTPTVCVRDFSQPNGNICTDWAVCTSMYCAVKTGAKFGVCTAQGKVGEACVSDILPNRQACVALAGCAMDGKCHEIVGFGEACDGSFSDESVTLPVGTEKLCPGYCENKVCRLAKAGERCKADEQCESNSCDQSQADKPVCTKALDWFSKCTQDTDCRGSGGWLKGGTTCGANGTCVQPFSLGDGEKATMSLQCQWGTFFDATAKKCVKDLKCTADKDCWYMGGKQVADDGVKCDCGNSDKCVWEINPTDDCVYISSRISLLPRTPAAQMDAFRTGYGFDENFRRFGDYGICQCSEGSKWAMSPPVCTGEADCADILDAEKKVCPDKTGYRQENRETCEFYGCCYQVTANGPWCYFKPEPRGRAQTCARADAGKCAVSNMMSVFLPACEHTRSVAKCFQKSDCMLDIIKICTNTEAPCPEQLPEYC